MERPAFLPPATNPTPNNSSSRPKRKRSGEICSPANQPPPPPPQLVISTGAQRSGETCVPAHQPQTQHPTTRHLDRSESAVERSAVLPPNHNNTPPPTTCHLDRSAAKWRDLRSCPPATNPTPNNSSSRPKRKRSGEICSPATQPQQPPPTTCPSRPERSEVERPAFLPISHKAQHPTTRHLDRSESAVERSAVLPTNHHHPPHNLSSRPERSEVERPAFLPTSHKPNTQQLVISTEAKAQWRDLQSCHPTTTTPPPQLAISTGAQRSGETCVPAHQPQTQHPTTRHLDRSESAVERSAVLPTNHHPPPQLVISTGAQRSGETCVPAHQPQSPTPNNSSSRPKRKRSGEICSPANQPPPPPPQLVLSTGAQRSGETCVPTSHKPNTSTTPLHIAVVSAILSCSDSMCPRAS